MTTIIVIMSPMDPTASLSGWLGTDCWPTAVER